MIQHYEWFSIYGLNWDIRDAHVACRQVGFTDAAQAFNGQQFGLGKNRLMDTFNCVGNESMLTECDIVEEHPSKDKHSGQAGVECSVGKSKYQIRFLLLVLFSSLLAAFLCHVAATICIIVIEVMFALLFLS